MVTKLSSEAVCFIIPVVLTSAKCLSGKTIREGMGQATNRSASETLDLVVTNALIVDWSGIYKVRVMHVSCSNSHTFLGGYRCEGWCHCRYRKGRKP